ncbi:S8 family serine peptidase [Streptomyces kaempferi]
MWLDGKSKGALADSTAQIGAPAAWASGGTGAGVRVAILDTGVDTTHPDLKDRIVESKSFVPGEDILDRFGHGTHTASTIAGTGAASGGKEKESLPRPICWWGRCSATRTSVRTPGSSTAWNGRRRPSTPR